MAVGRRRLLTGALAGLAATGMPSAAPGGTTAVVRRRVGPVVVSSANGHRFRNGGTVTCVEKAFAMITSGAAVLDAVIAGVNIVEADPDDTGVGYGGLPNADGVVQLDASCMDGVTRRAGAVACLEGVRHPSLVARAVMEHTDHHLLVGADAGGFARRMGFSVEDTLMTDRSRRLWLEWKRRTDPDHYPDPLEREVAHYEAGLHMVAEGLIPEEHFHGTINCNAVGTGGELAGVTTTSGLAWKIPGRVGDSPILGAGLYVDGAVAAVGSTGRGEANLFQLSSFLIVENLRRGLAPKDAALDALKRIRANTTENRLLNRRQLPRFNVNFYMVTAAGEHMGASLYQSRYAVCDANGARLVATEALLPGSPRDDG